MNLTSRVEIRNLLKKHQIQPSKWLGQNFLANEGVVEKFIQAAETTKNDVILEIGPGLGVLTQELVKSAKRVIAVEKDLKMCEILKETLKNYKNVEIVLGDILKIGNWKLEIGNYKVVGNLPFYLTSPVIRKFLEVENPPELMVLGIQKEVAQRICAKVPDMNLLAVSVQFYAAPTIISFVSKKSFWPQPKVDAIIIKIVPKPPSKNPTIVGFFDTPLFFKIVKAGFSQPRKQLINNLSKGLKLSKESVKGWLLKNNIRPIQRAETLTVRDWLNLTKSLK